MELEHIVEARAACTGGRVIDLQALGDGRAMDITADAVALRVNGK